MEDKQVVMLFGVLLMIGGIILTTVTTTEDVGEPGAQVTVLLKRVKRSILISGMG